MGILLLVITKQSAIFEHNYKACDGIKRIVYYIMPPKSNAAKFKTGCRVKCVLVGDGGVGKTCILSSYVKGQFPKEYIPTVFDNESCPMVIDGLTINLELWDTAGQEGYARIRPLAYNTADIFVACFDITNKDSLSNIKKLWAPELRSHCKDVPILLVGTKLDLRKENPKISSDHKAGENMANEIKAAAYVESSALTQEGLKELFEAAVRIVLCSPDEMESTPGCFGKFGKLCNML